MDKLWALVTPSKQLIFTSDDYHQLKLTQLLMAKSVFLDLVEWNSSNVVDSELEWTKKVQYVWEVLQAEQRNAATVIESRSKTQIKALLTAIQDFNSLVYPDNPQFSDMINLELEEIDRYKAAITVYKSFLFRKLHELDFLLSPNQIHSNLKRKLEAHPIDDYLVCAELNDLMLESINIQ